MFIFKMTSTPDNSNINFYAFSYKNPERKKRLSNRFENLGLNYKFIITVKDL